ncbi:MAG: YdeI/OmpD-associated family protein [Coriobacteriia bacterium]|nr:YdeI/OmpD-associated family protein [Coriobacteriia bacterium]
MGRTEVSPGLEDLARVEPASRVEFRAWLGDNSDSSAGIWLAVGKKGNQVTTLSYDDAVEEALCFGWIDSTVRRLDADRFLQLFTPRRPGSIWARTNKVRVERMIAEGLMMPAGLAVIERAKADGSWTLLDDVEALVTPEDLAAALAATPGAASGFEALPPSIRKQQLYRIASVKRPETRARHIAAAVAMAQEAGSAR